MCQHTEMILPAPDARKWADITVDCSQLHDGAPHQTVNENGRRKSLKDVFLRLKSNYKTASTNSRPSQRLTNPRSKSLPAPTATSPSPCGNAGYCRYCEVEYETTRNNHNGLMHSFLSDAEVGARASLVSSPSTRDISENQPQVLEVDCSELFEHTPCSHLSNRPVPKSFSTQLSDTAAATSHSIREALQHAPEAVQTIIKTMSHPSSFLTDHTKALDLHSWSESVSTMQLLGHLRYGPRDHPMLAGLVQHIKQSPEHVKALVHSLAEGHHLHMPQLPLNIPLHATTSDSFKSAMDKATSLVLPSTSPNKEHLQQLLHRLHLSPRKRLPPPSPPPSPHSPPPSSLPLSSTSPTALSLALLNKRAMSETNVLNLVTRANYFAQRSPDAMWVFRVACPPATYHSPKSLRSLLGVNDAAVAVGPKQLFPEIDMSPKAQRDNAPNKSEEGKKWSMDNIHDHATVGVGLSDDWEEMMLT